MNGPNRQSKTKLDSYFTYQKKKLDSYFLVLNGIYIGAHSNQCRT